MICPVKIAEILNRILVVSFLPVFLLLFAHLPHNLIAFYAVCNLVTFMSLSPFRLFPLSSFVAFFIFVFKPTSQKVSSKPFFDFPR